MKHVMKLHNEPYQLIKNGFKTIELRLYDEKRRTIAVGDEIEFVNTKNSNLSFRCCVLALHRFPTFKELYAALPLLKCGYTESNVAMANPTDMELYYTVEQQQKYGVVGIELKLL